MNTRLFAAVGVAASLLLAQPTFAQGKSDSTLVVPVAGTVKTPGALEPVAATGTFAIKRFGVVGKEIRAFGVLTLQSPTGVNVVSTSIPLVLPGASAAQMASKLEAVSAAAITPAATCDILNLTLGPLHLNVLGLVIDLNQVVLNITAESGGGNLLGNLLCAVANLLNGVNLSTLLQQIVNVLNQILGAL